MVVSVKQTALGGFERVDILDGLVEIAILGERQAVLPAGLDQDPHEREQKMEMISGVGSTQNGLIVNSGWARPTRQALPPSWRTSPS